MSRMMRCSSVWSFLCFMSRRSWGLWLLYGGAYFTGLGECAVLCRAVLCAVQRAVAFGATVLARRETVDSRVLATLDNHEIAFGSQSCATRLVFAGSVRLRPRSRPRMPPWSHSSLHLGFRSRSRSASCRSRSFVSPPAARCFVGGIPPFSPRLHLAAKAANRVNPASLNSTLKPSRRSSPRQRCVCLRSISGGASHRLGQGGVRVLRV